MRKKTLWLLGISLLFLILVTVLGIVWEDAAQQVDFARKNLPPGTGGLFGTDWMGRDMLKRTGAGLSLSIRLGLLTAAISAAQSAKKGSGTIWMSMSSALRIHRSLVKNR